MSDLFDKLAAQENSFFNSQFFSPVLKNKPVRVRIAEVIVAFKIAQPKNFEGWGVFAPINSKTAKFIRDPNLAEKQAYFKLFPAIRLILCRRDGDSWYGMPANHDSRFKITGTVPIKLATEVQLFDTVLARFDGMNIWFEQIDPRHSVKNSVYLRESVNKLTPKDKLELSGLTIEETDAYLMALNIAIEADKEAKRDKQEEQIKSALHRAGAKYKSYIERGDTYTIEYDVNGSSHRSVVKKGNLAVESAGICLAGTDRTFDLQSLVSVIKEGQRRGRIVNYFNNGDGYRDGYPENHGYENREDYDDDY